jgi:hypothetical protein
MVYIDCDDVLAESTRSYIDLLRREFGIEKTFEDIRSFNLQESFGLTREQYDHFFEVVHSREEILKFDPMPGAIETIREWKALGVEIAIVTGRLTVAYRSTLEWLAKHHVPFDRFVMVNKYNRPDMDSRIAISLDELSRLGFHFAIEDSLAMAEFLASRMNLRVALMDRPWNRAAPLDLKIMRVASWAELKALNWPELVGL